MTLRAAKDHATVFLPIIIPSGVALTTDGQSVRLGLGRQHLVAVPRFWQAERSRISTGLEVCRHPSPLAVRGNRVCTSHWRVATRVAVVDMSKLRKRAAICKMPRPVPRPRAAHPSLNY